MNPHTEQVAELTRQGLSQRAIAAELHIGRRVIRLCQKEAGLSGQQVSNYDNGARVAALTAQGLSQSEIAERLGIDPCTVQYHQRHHGLAPARPDPHKPSVLCVDEVRRLTELGTTQDEIGKLFGVHGSVVGKFMQKHGIPKAQISKADTSHDATIHELTRQHMTQRQIAAAIGKTQTFVCTRQRALGIKGDCPRGPAPKPRQPKAAKPKKEQTTATTQPEHKAPPPIVITPVWTGPVVLRLAQGERWCPKCGETAFKGFCTRCGNRKLLDPASVLRPEEYYIAA